jgi:predicted RNase H-like nuclease (RuvC/YqgF family)
MSYIEKLEEQIEQLQQKLANEQEFTEMLRSRITVQYYGDMGYLLVVPRDAPLIKESEYSTNEKIRNFIDSIKRK